MKISTIQQKEGQSLSDATTEAAIATLIGYAKMTTLLHKQLWDKDQLKATGVEGEDYINYDNNGDVLTNEPYQTRVNMINHEITINGRVAKPIIHWNIKSWSKNPYSPTDLFALGLNQLFEPRANPDSDRGWSPYEYLDLPLGSSYQGIYHDTCLIQPKGEDLPSYDRYGWYIEGNGDWVAKSVWGEDLVTNVYSYEKFITIYHPEVPAVPAVPATDTDPGSPGSPAIPAWTEEVSQGMYAVVVTPSGSSEFPISDIWVDLGEEGSEYQTPSVEYVNFSATNYGTAYPRYSQYIEVPDMSEHGAITYESTDVGYTRPIGSYQRAFLFSGVPQALTRVYEDGTCVQFTVPVTYEYTYDEGTVGYDNVSGTIKYLPLVYTDTGDLVQNRVAFIETWEDMFELYVNESGYWYSGLIQIVIIVVAIVISIVSYGVLAGEAYTAGGAALAAFGGALSGIGAVSGNKMLSILGAIITLGVNLYAMGATEVAKQAAMQAGSEEMATQLITDAMADMTVTQAISGLSGIGMKNIVSLALQVNSLITTITNGLESVDMLPSEETQAEDGTKLTMIDEEDDYVSKVMKIGELPSMDI